jgi:hypothetical protein
VGRGGRSARFGAISASPQPHSQVFVNDTAAIPSGVVYDVELLQSQSKRAVSALQLTIVPHVDGPPGAHAHEI